MDKKIVLLVEDNPEEIVIATKILRGQGFKVMIATNLTDAMSYFKMLEGKLSGIGQIYISRKKITSIRKTARTSRAGLP